MSIGKANRKSAGDSTDEDIEIATGKSKNKKYTNDRVIFV